MSRQPHVRRNLGISCICMLFVTYPVTPCPRLSASTRRRLLVRAQHRPYRICRELHIAGQIDGEDIHAVRDGGGRGGPHDVSQLLEAKQRVVGEPNPGVQASAVRVSYPSPLREYDGNMVMDPSPL
jgi:hypothetical protein